MVIPIRNDNGFPECLDCLHFESKVCKFCTDAELFEDEFEDQFENADEKELEFA